MRLDPSPGVLAPPVVFDCSCINGDPDATCVHVVGELDIATAPHLELTLRKAQSQARLVVLDLRDLAFIDGAGVDAIVNATARARQAGRRIVPLRCPAHVERLFVLSATAELLERDHAGAANRSLSRAGAAGDYCGALASGLAYNVTSALMTRAVAVVPWLRDGPASEPPGSPSAEAGATARW